MDKESLIANSFYLQPIRSFFDEWDVTSVCLVPKIDTESLPLRLSDFTEIVESHLLDAAETIQCDWIYKVKLRSKT